MRLKESKVKRSFRFLPKLAAFFKYFMFSVFLQKKLLFLLAMGNLTAFFQFTALLFSEKGRMNGFMIAALLVIFVVAAVSIFLVWKIKATKNGDQNICLTISSLILLSHGLLVSAALHQSNSKATAYAINFIMIFWISVKPLKKPLFIALILLSVSLFLAFSFDNFIQELSQFLLFLMFLYSLFFRKFFKLSKNPKFPTIKKTISKSKAPSLSIDSKKLESERLERHALLRSLQEAIMIFDSKLKMTFCNKFVFKLFRVPSDSSPCEIEQMILALKEDEEAKKMTGLSARTEDEIMNFFRVFHTKIAGIQTSMSEINDDSSFFSKNHIKSNTSLQPKCSSSFYTHPKSQSMLNSFTGRSETKRIKYKQQCLLNKNLNIKKKIDQENVTGGERGNTLRDVLVKYFQLPDSEIRNVIFYAKSEDNPHLFQVHFLRLEEDILLLIKQVSKSDPILIANELQKNQHKIMASLCHELRNPLNSITNMLELMQKNDRDSEIYLEDNQREYLLNAKQNSQFLLHAINDFFDYFSISSKIFELDIKKFDLKKLIMDLYSLFQSFSGKKKIHFINIIPDKEDFTCINDPRRIQQIVTNLLKNAFKYTNAAGRVIIRLKSKNSELYEISVKDSGCGISSEIIRRLGQFQISNMQTLGGFGLYISNSLCNYLGPVKVLDSDLKLYQGIKLKTTKDKGSRFSFLIEKRVLKLQEEVVEINDTNPIEIKNKNFCSFSKFHKHNYRFFNSKHQTATFQTFNQTLIEEGHCSCHKVLAVDDNEFNLFVLKEKFKREGFEIETASSGVEAIQKITRMQENNFEMFCPRCRFYKLILMDIDMPVKNGYQTSKEILSLLEKAGIQIKIVALSAFSSQGEEKKKALESGMIDYFEKPFRVDTMKIILRNYLR